MLMSVLGPKLMRTLDLSTFTNCTEVLAERSHEIKGSMVCENQGQLRNLLSQRKESVIWKEVWLRSQHVERGMKMCQAGRGCKNYPEDGEGDVITEVGRAVAICSALQVSRPVYGPET